MKCIWLGLMLLSLVAAVLGAGSCPAGFAADNNRCIKDRPVHGTCPPGSDYQLSINKCVHV